jgi:hypothetical protein
LETKSSLFDKLERTDAGPKPYADPTGRLTRPDFLATRPDGSRLYVEATLCTDESDEERAAEAVKNVVYDQLNEKLGPTASSWGWTRAGRPSGRRPARS